MARRWAILLLLLSALAMPAQAQKPWEVSLGGEYLLTAYSFRSPHNTWGTGLEVACFPLVTDSYSYGLKFDFGLTPQNLCGNRIGAAFIIRTPLLRWLDADIGLGLSSYSKPRYVTHDTNNVYITTPVVCLFDLGLVARLDRGSFVALRLLHSSNGNMRRPNRGLNYFRLEMGFPLSGSAFGSRRSVVPRTAATTQDAYHELGFMVAPSLTISRHSMQHGLYFCYDVSLNYEYRHTPVWGYGGSLDLWYNYSHPWQLPRYHDNYTLPMYFSTLAFVERFWGPLSVKGGIGVVLAASSRVMVPVYERLAIYYNFGNNYAGIGINAHGGQAEFIEWSYGHRFPLRRR